MTLARWIPPVGVGLVVAAGTAYTGLADPNSPTRSPSARSRAGTWWTAPPAALSARSTRRRLDLAAAADHNLLFVLAVPFLVIGYALWLGRTLGWQLPRCRCLVASTPPWRWPSRSPLCATCPFRAKPSWQRYQLNIPRSRAHSEGRRRQKRRRSGCAVPELVLSDAGGEGLFRGSIRG